MKGLSILKLLLVLCALGMFLSQSALAQEEEQPKPVSLIHHPIVPPIDGIVLCPDPQTIYQTVSAPAPAVIDPSQVPSPLFPPQLPEPNFGGTIPNRYFVHTFQFNLPTNICCQCTNVTLILKLRALLDASDGTHQYPNASNDKWYIFLNQKPCGNYDSNWVYDSPVSMDTEITKTIKVPCQCLAEADNVGKLTFVIQDDTSVQEATMIVHGCCVQGREAQ